MLKKICMTASCIALLSGFSSSVAAEQSPVIEDNDKTNLSIMGNMVSSYACSGIFVGGRKDYASFSVDMDIWTTNFFAASELSKLEVNVDHKTKTVNVKRKGVDLSTSVFREGLGCAVVLENYSADKLRQETTPTATPLSGTEKNQLWPAGERVILDGHGPDIDQAALDAALDFAFKPPKAGDVDPLTRGVVIVYKGKIVGERYAPGFTSESLQYGASLSKSITNALVGIRIKDKKLDLKWDHLLPEWQDDTDPRSKINLDHLLRMSTGLAFKGNHAPLDADGNIMLFMRADMAGFAASKPLEHPIDTQYRYTCATSNIISKLVRNTFDGDTQAYWNFPRERLFDKLGMRHIIFQTDASGTFVGSSYTWASPRDFARLGLLYLQNGRWNGEQLWPEDWVSYSTTPTTTLLNGVSADNPIGYGAQLWLSPPLERDVPAAAYFMLGWADQSVYMVPDKDLVIVRMGMTKPGSNAWDFKSFATLVQAAFPEEN